MTNYFNIQNCFESSNEKNSIKLLSNGKVLININNQIYIFDRSSKSRFFNLFKNEDNTQISNTIKENNIKNNNNPDLLIKNELDITLNKKKKEIKVLKEREGDWICYFCKNLNFSFRDFCNRCQKTKEESAIMIKKFYYLYAHLTQINNMCNKKINKKNI